MDTPLPKVDRVSLRARFWAEFEWTVDTVLDAVDNAATSRLIRDREASAQVAWAGSKRRTKMSVLARLRETQGLSHAGDVGGQASTITVQRG